MAKLHFYYSAMNAGKSTTLLQSSYNYYERGMDTLIFVPKIDYRFGVGTVTSRIGLKSDAIAIDTDFELFNYVQNKLAENSNIKCVLVDEAQFLTKKQVIQLCHITDELRIPVLAYGLRSDFRGNPFEGSLYLLTLADLLIELKTICYCGKKAIMNLRMDSQGRRVKNGLQIEIGGNEMYTAVCRRHFELRDLIPEDSAEE